MAKKTRRVRQPGQRTPLQRPAAPQSSTTPTTPVTYTSGTRAFRPAMAANMPAKKVDFREEYKYVGRDLRQVAVISVAVLVFLVVLAQFVH
jgi:hypothetical protein